MASYAFEQLDAPPPGSADDVADVLPAARAEAEQIREQARAGRPRPRAAPQALEPPRPSPSRRCAALAARRRGRAQLRDELAAAGRARRRRAGARARRARSLAGALAVEPERVVDVVRGALRRLVERERVIARSSTPHDLEHRARRGRRARRRSSAASSTARCRPSGASAAAARSCAPSEGEIDARVETKLERAREVVDEAASLRRAADAADVDALERPRARGARDREADLHRRRGRVSDLIGLIIEATGLRGRGRRGVHDRRRAAAARAGPRRGRRLPRRPHAADAARRAARDRPGHARHRRPARRFASPVGDALLGRVLDGLGRADRRPAARPDDRARAARPGAPPDAAHAPAHHTSASALGVRALDALVPCGRGQRLGIFAGSGVGKSSLLGMIARSTTRRAST